MRHVPILRRGEPYRSLDLRPLCDPETGEALLEVSLANPGMLRRDARPKDTPAVDDLPGLQYL